MPRKKTAKRSIKRQAATSSFDTMHKEFLQTPAKLLACIATDVTALKQKENKLKVALNKAKTQVKNSEARIKQASAKANTTTGKKQLKAAKKAHAKVCKVYTGVNKELQEVAKCLANSMQQQSKLTALRKQLSQFQKEWAKNLKNAKQAKATTKAKPKTKLKTKTRRSSKKMSGNGYINPQAEAMTLSAQEDDASMNEKLEAVS